VVRRTHARGRQSQSSVALPLFIVLFVFTFAIMVYTIISWRKLDAMIHGSQAKASDYDKVEKDGNKYLGYVFQLEEKDEKLRKEISEKNKLESVIGMSGLNEIEDKLKDLREDLGKAYQRTGDSDTFVVMIRRLQERANALQGQLGIAKRSQEDAEKDAGQWKETAEESARKLDVEVERIRKEYARNLEVLNDSIATKETRITELQNRIVEISSEFDKERDKTKSELTLANRERQRLAKALENLQSKKIGGTDYNVDYDEVDGVVYSVDNTGEACVVDVGRRQGAQVGLQFIVYETNASGKRIEKGTVELKRVDENQSYAGVTSLKDKLNPILVNDIIISPIFKRGEPIIFVFEKNIDRAERAVWTKKIEKFGNKVADTVSSDTSYVVIKDMPGDIAMQAGTWGVRVINITHIAKVLGEH